MEIGNNRSACESPDPDHGHDGYFAWPAPGIKGCCHPQFIVRRHCSHVWAAVYHSFFALLRAGTLEPARGKGAICGVSLPARQDFSLLWWLGRLCLWLLWLLLFLLLLVWFLWYQSPHEFDISLLQQTSGQCKLGANHWLLGCFGVLHHFQTGRMDENYLYQTWSGWGCCPPKTSPMVGSSVGTKLVQRFRSDLQVSTASSVPWNA